MRFAILSVFLFSPLALATENLRGVQGDDGTNFERRMLEAEAAARTMSPKAMMPLVAKGVEHVQKTLKEDPDKARRLMDLVASKLGHENVEQITRNLAGVNDMPTTLAAALDMHGETTKMSAAENLRLLHEGILGLEDVNARTLALQVESTLTQVYSTFFDAQGNERMVSVNDLRQLAMVLKQDEIMSAATDMISMETLVDLVSTASPEVSMLLGDREGLVGKRDRDQRPGPLGDDIEDLPAFLLLPFIYIVFSVAAIIIFIIPPLTLLLPFVFLLIIILFPYVVVGTVWLFVCEINPDLEKCADKPVGDNDNDFLTL